MEPRLPPPARAGGGRLSNAWAMARASWAVLGRDRELLAVPVVTGVAVLLVVVVVGGAGVVLVGGPDEVESARTAQWVVGGLVAVGTAWVAALGQATLVAGAGERMAGGDPDLRSAWTGARARAGSLLGWAVLSTIVAAVLDVLEQRLGVLGRVVSWIGSVAFAALSFLALPVIVFEGRSAIDAFKRSGSLLRATWGEQIAFNLGTGLLGFLAVLPGVAVGFALVASGVLPLVVLGAVAVVGWVLAVAVVTSALSAVFKTALYRWVNGLPVDPAFDAATLGAAFRRR